MWRQLSRASLIIRSWSARGCLIGGVTVPLKQTPQLITLGKSLNELWPAGAPASIRHTHACAGLS